MLLGANALGGLDRGTAFLRGSGVACGVDAGVSEHHLDALVDAQLIGKARARLRKGDELPAHAVGVEVDLGAVVHHRLGLRMD